MVWIRRGVDWRPNWQIDNAVRKMESKFRDVDIFVTSCRDGMHGLGTLHHQGDAIDIRPLSGYIVGDVEMCIGQGFDVVDERNHWHIEWDPK